MPRSLAGLLFGLASIVGSLAVSGFWLQFTAFSPDRTRAAAAAVLQDKDIKNEFANVIATATAAQLPDIAPVDLQNRILQVAGTKAGAKLLAGIIADAHTHLIGSSNKPVLITSEELVEVVRDQRAFLAPAVTLAVPRVKALSAMRQILKWLVPIAGGFALLLIILGFAARPEKSELFRSMSLLLFGMALLLVVIGYVVPAFVVPAITHSLWAGIVPRLARDSLVVLLGLVLLLGVGGLACLAGASASKRRDRWSQPIRRTSYREERRWS